MNTSEQINEIAKALAAAQAGMENAGKNAVNPHFKNKYADLAEVLNVVRPALAGQGIAIAQLTSTQGDVLVLHTRLLHTSGQWIESEYPVCKLPTQPQQMGAAMTYARRYSLASVCGIAQEDDDLADGKGAGTVGAPKRKEPPKADISSVSSDRVLAALLTALAKAESMADLFEFDTNNSIHYPKLSEEHFKQLKAKREDLENQFMDSKPEAAE